MRKMVTPPSTDRRSANDEIRILGARENNLKNVTLSIPKKKITIFTGLSGSGKSSLVFDTIAAGIAAPA